MKPAVRPKDHIPDILDCLAQLSNDEVPTPPKLARTMLDLLPIEVWSNPNYKWLDPGCKSGVFLREIASRLLEGLTAWEPELNKRREHIFRNMLYGTSVTEMTGNIARRSVYYSRNASSTHSVVSFESEAGNIVFIPAEHTFRNERCTVCGAPEDLERGDTRENYAYAFIHSSYPTKEMSAMKFDVIVGNPPYQIDSDGNTRTKPVYNLFIERAIEMDPRYVLMITPSRWFAGGLGLDGFRARMLDDHRLEHIVDFPQSKDCFPGVKIRGGVSYFLWNRQHTSGCTVKTVRGARVGSPMTRKLDAYDVFVRYNEGVHVLDKVRARGDAMMDGRVSSLVPFGIRAKFRDYVPPGTSGAVALHVMGRKIQWVARDSITSGEHWIDKHKTLLHAAYGEDHEGPYTVIAQPLVAKPNSACTETYLVIGAFDSAGEAEHLDRYLRTRLVRFLIWLRMNTQHVSKDRFAFVPDLPMDRVWTDEMLYSRYGLTDDEITFVESQIKEMAPPKSEGNA